MLGTHDRLVLGSHLTSHGINLVQESLVFLPERLELSCGGSLLIEQALLSSSLLVVHTRINLSFTDLGLSLLSLSSN